MLRDIVSRRYQRWMADVLNVTPVRHCRWTTRRCDGGGDGLVPNADMAISAIPSSRLLQLAVPLVHSYGFTREALARSVLSLPPSEAHSEPLPDSAVSALFGHGTLAPRRLIHAWLDEGVRQITATPSGSPLKDVLSARLRFNEPVLHHLPEVTHFIPIPFLL